MAYGDKSLITKVPMLSDIWSNILSLFERNLVKMAILETFAQYRFAEVSHILIADRVLSIFLKL